MSSNDDPKKALNLIPAATTVLVPVVVSTGFSMISLSPPEFTYAKLFFVVAGIVLTLAALTWLTINEYAIYINIVVGLLVGSTVFVALPITLKWINHRQRSFNHTFVTNPSSSLLDTSPSPRTPVPAAVQGPKTSLTEADIHDFAEHVQSLIPQAITLNIFSPDIYTPYAGLQQELVRIFRQLGHDSQPTNLPMKSPDQTGLILYVKDVNDVPPVAQKLQQLFASYGLVFRFETAGVYEFSLNKLGFTIFLGPTPL